LQKKTFNNQAEAENAFDESFGFTTSDFYQIGIMELVSFGKSVICNGFYFD
jgi:hypothetical protein